MIRCRWAAPLVLLFLVLVVAVAPAPQYPVVRTSGGGETETADFTIDDTTGVAVASTAVETPRLDGTDATGTDVAGEDLLIAAGQGTGTGDGGNIDFEVALADVATSDVLNTRDVVARLEGATGRWVLWLPLRLIEQADTPASNPATGSWLLYPKSDGLYYLDDAGTETGPLVDASGAGTSDHGALTGLADDDHTQYLLADGTRALTGAWDAGSFNVRAETFTSDVATGTAPFTVSSTTAVTNLNADLLDGQEGSYYLDSANFTGTDWDDLTDSGSTTLHTHDHGGMGGLGDDDHTQYALLAGRSGGQTLYGGTASGNNLTLESTSNATKGTIIANDLIDAVTGVEIDTGSYIEFTNGANAVQASPSGTELLIDSDGATMNSIGINDLDVVVKTGDVTVTAGDITATAGDIIAAAGDVLVTTGGVGIGSGAPSALLHVDSGGTLPGLDGTADAVIQDTDFAIMSLIAPTSVGFNFGDASDENAGNLIYDHSTNRIRARLNGGAIAAILDSSGFWVLNALTAEGGATIGNGSNTRWCKVNLLSGLVDSGTATLSASTSAIYWEFPASTSGAVFFQVPDSIVGSKIKQVRVYVNVMATVAGTDIDLTAYSSSSTTGALTSLSATSYNANSTTSTSITMTLGSAYTHTAGTNMYILVGQDSTLGDAQTNILAIEVEFQEREY